MIPRRRKISSNVGREWPATRIEYADEYLDHAGDPDTGHAKPEDIFSAGGLVYQRADIVDPMIGHALSSLNATIVSIRARLTDEGVMPEIQE